ncbi:MAG: glycerol acyltransferase [Gammaproteobacteria bacterium]|nr:MAG: glycerol acyltransferase [Gammaproteobacteria bacterium]RLA16296.1 MAG: glycerol acyltransferase [Gammaproteobacteria bacterium]
MHNIPAGFHFKVEFKLGEPTADNRFQEVTGLTAEVTVEELREGGLNQYAHKLPTGAKYGNLLLKRGFISDSSITDWCRNALENFSFDPVDVGISLLNEKHEPLAVWEFMGAWPVKWSVSDFKAQENALVIESLELAYRMFRKVG